MPQLNTCTEVLTNIARKSVLELDRELRRQEEEERQKAVAEVLINIVILFIVVLCELFQWIASWFRGHGKSEKRPKSLVEEGNNLKALVPARGRSGKKREHDKVIVYVLQL